MVAAKAESAFARWMTATAFGRDIQLGCRDGHGTRTRAASWPRHDRPQGRGEIADGESKHAGNRRMTADVQSTEQQRPVAISCFSGAMGLDRGLEEAGFSVRLAVEIDQDARATIKANRPHLPVLDDLRQLAGTDLRAAAGIGKTEIVSMVGGAPCQTYSLAGKRQGLADPRGGLLLTFVDLALDLRPRYVVVENVRGLLLDPAFDQVVGQLRDGGYAVSFNVYDTACFGVPQQRERLIIVASSSGGRVPYLTPTNSDRPEDGLPPWRTLRDAIGDMTGVEHHGARYSRKRLELWRLLKEGQDGRHLRDVMQPADRTIGRKACYYKRLAWDKPAPTLVTKPGSFLSGCCHPDADRPLSINEYKRLQTFPDDWVVCGSITSQYRQIGNAVPVLFGKAIGLAILQHMRLGSSDDPVPGFRYSRYAGTGDKDWCGAQAAKARLDEIAPKVRRINRKTRRSLLVVVRDALLRARKAGLLLREAKNLCRKCGTPFEPWVRKNCGMSERTAQGYMRIAKHWDEIRKAQSSALFSIDAALKFLSRRKPDEKDVTPPGEPTMADPPDDDRDEGIPAGLEPEPTIADGDDAPEEDGRQTTEDDDGGRYQEMADKPSAIAKEELPPVTDDQIAAADSFVAAVGGLEQAARALVARSIKGGGNDGLKSVMAATVRAASELLTPSEIAEIAIVDSARAKGIQWVSV